MGRVQGLWGQWFYALVLYIHKTSIHGRSLNPKYLYLSSGPIQYLVSELLTDDQFDSSWTSRESVFIRLPDL
jgi:hypothetical protein